MHPPSHGPDLPREIEVKLAVSAAAPALAVLEQDGFAPLHERAFETNVLLDNATGDLLHSRRLLRVREFRGETILTFKGPPEAGRHKTRVEVETQVDDRANLMAILAGLGYRVTFSYEKYRTTLARTGETGLAVLDETPIGVFLELEGTADWIDATAARLGFATDDYILKSYGSLFREYCESHHWHSRDMVFPPV